MFSRCSGLTSLDLSNFDTSNVTDMRSMFSRCSGLTSLDLSNFDTSKVTNMFDMFSGCSSLTNLDLSNFDMSKLEYSSDMFSELKTDALIIVKDEGIKAQILNINGDLTNVVVKAA